jgi:hypothetical protein
LQLPHHILNGSSNLKADDDISNFAIPSIRRYRNPLPDYQDSLVDVFGPPSQRMNAPVCVQAFRLPWIKVRREVFVEALHVVECLIGCLRRGLARREGLRPRLQVGDSLLRSR